jgi:transcriptional regulator NrdR family protein
VAAEGAKGCPRCGQRGRITDTRALVQHNRRRYACACGYRWTTIECRVEDIAADSGASIRGRVREVLVGLLQELGA